MLLEGKRIIVTGGAAGIGASVVKAYAAQGAKVASLDIDDRLGNQVAAQAGTGPGSVRYLHCDVSARPEVEDAFRLATDHLGGLDAMVNIAGVERSSPAQDITDQEWDLIFNVNARGTLLTNQAAFRYMRASGGKILNFASGAGVGGMAGGAHYSASKGAVLSWTRTVAQEWGKFDITVNALVPAMWTPMYDEHRSRMRPEALARHDAMMASRVLVGGRLGDPDRDLAPVMIFLVSDGARFITGQTISVDGGMCMVR